MTNSTIYFPEIEEELAKIGLSDLDYEVVPYQAKKHSSEIKLGLDFEVYHTPILVEASPDGVGFSRESFNGHLRAIKGVQAGIAMYAETCQ